MIDKRGDVWIYPSGRIRLKGKVLEALRRERWVLDKGICAKCGQLTRFHAQFDGDPQAYDMAHIVSRGAGGSDTLDNVETNCHECHMKSHNAGGKPVPAK